MTIHNFGIQPNVTPQRPTTRLRQLLRSGEMVTAPFVLNAYHAVTAAALF